MIWACNRVLQLCIAVPCHMFKLWAFSGIMFQVTLMSVYLILFYQRKKRNISLHEFCPADGTLASFLLKEIAILYAICNTSEGGGGRKWVCVQPCISLSAIDTRVQTDEHCVFWFALRFPWSWSQITCKISSETLW